MALFAWGPLLDAANGLNRVNGNEVLYRRLLGRLRLRFAEFEVLLAKGWEQSDWTGLVESSHGLKGVAATLGAHRVADAAFSLQKEAKVAGQQGGSPQLVLVALTELIRVVKLTDQELESAGILCPRAPVVAGPDVFRNVDVDKFRQAIRLGDIAALQEQVSHLSEKHVLRVAIDNFDLASVRRLLS